LKIKASIHDKLTFQERNHKLTCYVPIRSQFNFEPSINLNEVFPEEKSSE